MKQGYYSEIAPPREALYEAACAMDNQDVPLEDWPVKLIAPIEQIIHQYDCIFMVARRSVRIFTITD